MLDFTQRMFSAQGTNLIFDSLETARQYFLRKWELKDEDLTHHELELNPEDLEGTGCECYIFKCNEHEAKIIGRILVTMDTVGAAADNPSW